MARSLSLLLVFAVAPGLIPMAAGSASGPPVIPAATATALDGHRVILPRDLAHGATVLIVGFGRNSADATTAWETPVHNTLARTPGIGFFDMPMLAEAPALVRPLILRSIRRPVPDAVRPNFVPLTADADAWKRAAAFTPTAPDAAYVLLVDSAGRILWQTHAAFNAPQFDELARAARQLAGVSPDR